MQRLHLQQGVERPLCTGPVAMPGTYRTGTSSYVPVIEEAYAKINFPATAAARFTTLMTDFKQLLSFATEDANLYKRTRLAIAELLNTKHAGSGDVNLAIDSGTPAALAGMIRAPVRSKSVGGRVTNADIRNGANRSNSRTKQPGGCTTCRLAGRVSTDSHRTGSKCPVIQEQRAAVGADVLSSSSAVPATDASANFVQHNIAVTVPEGGFCANVMTPGSVNSRKRRNAELQPDMLSE